jgi:glycosyltransferase involved in cell wall biosynthesis
MLNNEFPPLGGGTGTVNRALLTHWARVPDLEIDLVTSARGRAYTRESFAGRVQVHYVPVNNQNLHHSSNRELITYAARAMPYALKLHRANRYAFVFAWSALPAGAVALGLNKLAGLDYMVRVCGPDIPGFERRYGSLYPVLGPTIRATWRNARRVIAKCDDEAQMIQRVDTAVPVTIVPNGVDRNAFAPAQISDDGPLRILCVARLIERKGQEHLIRAVKRLTDEGVDVTLDLVGTGDAQSEYEMLAQALGVADRVRFVGYVPREEIAAHYASAHVFCLPSYNEGMSVATLEAMAAGLPVVVSRTPGTRELVQENVNGLLFDWGDVVSLAAHLSACAANREMTRRMGAASRARAARFGWENAAAAYMDLFRAAETHPVTRPRRPRQEWHETAS